MSVMMKSMAVFLVCGVGLAGAESSPERRDRATYNKLHKDIRKIDAQYQDIVNAGLEEARSSGGEPALATKAQLIALRNKRDRTMNRLVLVALRWGWDVPEFDGETVKIQGEHRTDKERVFAPADDIIRARLAKEASTIARQLVLPLIRVPSDHKGGEA